MGKLKKIIIVATLTIFSIALIYGISFYFSFFQGDIIIKDGIVKGKSINKEKLSSYKSNGYTSINTFESQPIEEISDIKISILNKNLPKDTKILLKSQRYYIPLDIVCSKLNFKIINNKPLKITNDKLKINFVNNNKCNINDNTYWLRGGIIEHNNQKFISISDIEYILGLTAIFNSEENSISIMKSNINKSLDKQFPLQNGKVALIRFEDVTAGGSFYDTENQAKFKAMGDFMYQNNLKFNIAWVPRYIHPDNNIDNDLLKEKNINNVGFINALDYLINCGGRIGLHGYTHQSNNTVSTVGSELTRNDNSTESETRAVIENAINTSTALNIPVSFFESPHYHATKRQKEIIGEYFQYQYEPYSILNYIGLKTTKNNNLFIPTPLGYIKDRNPKNIVEKLKNPTSNLLCSLFYHPSLELDYITLDSKNNVFNFNFEKDSILTSLVNALIENGYSTIHPSDFGTY